LPDDSELYGKKLTGWFLGIKKPPSDYPEGGQIIKQQQAVFCFAGND
jgi:hypothetical protein